MSNLATQARAIALLARQVVPTAVTVRLETSDQGEHMTESSPFIIDAAGNEHDAPDEIADELWDRTVDITWDQAGEGDCPGWTAINRRGGYYELDIDTVLGHKPEFKDSLLALTIAQFEHEVSVIPAEPPIIMAEVSEVTYKATFTPQAWFRNEAILVDPEGETTWGVSNLDAAERIVAENRGGLDRADVLKTDWAAPQWVRDWKGPFSITVEALNKPYIISMSAHCPRCGSTELAEMDWDLRWNKLSEPEFGEDGRSDDLFLGVGEGDSEHQTLVKCFCQGCGQVIELGDIETTW